MGPREERGGLLFRVVKFKERYLARRASLRTGGRVCAASRVDLCFNGHDEGGGSLCVRGNSLFLLWPKWMSQNGGGKQLSIVECDCSCCAVNRDRERHWQHFGPAASSFLPDLFSLDTFCYFFFFFFFFVAL